MFNPSHTVLLITRQVLARIDLSGRKRLSVKQIWTASSGDYDSILPEVSRAIKLGPRRLGRVTIVSADFWTDILSVPADVAAIANENEIRNALALEAEVGSGTSAFDSRTSVMRIGDATDRNDDCPWCVSQVPNSQIQQLSQTIRTFGSKLHSVAHPIATQLIATESVSVDAAQELLDRWHDQATFSADDVEPLAIAWVDCLSQKPPHPMVMMSESDVPANAQPVVLAVSIAMLAAAGCGLWHWQTQQSLATTTEAIERLEKQQSQQDASEAALKSAEATLAQLQQEVTKTQALRQATERQLKLAGAVHSLQNRRWLALVDALAESATENCWVQKLESNSSQTTIHGLALDNAAANGFAGRLELALRGTGWRTVPAATDVTSNNLIAFMIVLKAVIKTDETAENTGISLKPSLGAMPSELAGTKP